MQMKRSKPSLSLLVCCALFAATALFTTGCTSNETTSSASAAPESTAASEAATSTPDAAAAQTEGTVMGEGDTSFTFTVVNGDGQETVYQINTDQATVGDALEELGLIEGEDSEYGLYVTTVDGLTVDYDTDGQYWAFYVDGAYATSGVDTTEINPGSTYTFQVE